MRVGSVLFMDVTFLAQILGDLRLPFPAWLAMCCHTGLGGLAGNGPAAGKMGQGSVGWGWHVAVLSFSHPCHR